MNIFTPQIAISQHLAVAKGQTRTAATSPPHTRLPAAPLEPCCGASWRPAQQLHLYMKATALAHVLTPNYTDPNNIHHPLNQKGKELHLLLPVTRTVDPLPYLNGVMFLPAYSKAAKAMTHLATAGGC